MKETSDGKWVLCSQNDIHDDTSLDAEVCEEPGSGFSHLENFSVTDTIPKVRLEGNAPGTSHKAVRSTGRLDLDLENPRHIELSTPASLSGGATGHIDRLVHDCEPKSNSKRQREVEDLSRELEDTSIKETATGFSPYRVEKSCIQRSENEAVSVSFGSSRITTSAAVTRTDVSSCDPQLKPQRDVLENIMNLFKDKTDLKPAYVAQKCIGSKKTKKDINPYLYCLDKHKILKCVYNNPETKSDPRWSKGDNFHIVTEKDYYEMAAEILHKSGKPAKDESHVHHHHHHRHQNVIQVGDSPTANLNIPGIENQCEKCAERNVQEEED